ncbi:unnamed protein product [Strongylus vulgaris]|uniref:Neurotransmitter-gated ion-channel ligand-binding domain-containing protein n=1 Tax=Strongylus vulgaris TaxID=40348 RepID=A0A3P7J3V3_STRVU|nr:unnamed protein product [Strongylus vulgaris]
MVEHNFDYGSSFILPVLSSINYDTTLFRLHFQKCFVKSLQFHHLQDIPVIVAVQLNILYLANFDSELMEYSIDVEMELSWYDLRLANNYTKPIRIREQQILDLIWKPDPYFVNSKFSYLHTVSFPNFRMRIFPDGLVKYTMRYINERIWKIYLIFQKGLVRITSVCNCFMLFCLYPHDRQTCDLQISSSEFTTTLIMMD